jgi:hypothetical protein
MTKSDGSQPDKRSAAILRFDFLTMLDEIEAALKVPVKEGYTRRVIDVSVCDDCDAGSESVTVWEIDQADIDMLRAALTHPSAGGTSIDQAVRDAYRSALTYAASICDAKVFDRVDAFDNGCWSCAESIKAELAAINRDNPGDTPVSATGPITDWKGLYDGMSTLCEQQQRRASAAEARVDALMLEYCPDEMTPEQVENWKRHQRAATPEEEADVEAAISNTADSGGVKP